MSLLNAVVTRSALFLFVGALMLMPAAALAQTPPASSPTLDFSGVLFFNYQMRTDDAAKATAGGSAPNKFDIERVYLIFRMPVGDRGSMRVTTDIFQNTATGYYSGWTARLKHAYFQYEFSKNAFGVQGLSAVGRFGMLQTVVVDHLETFWPRWMGTTAVERNFGFSSADVGAATLLTLPKKRGEFYATIVNGSNYTSAETDRFKDIAARFSWTPFANDSTLFRTFTLVPWYSKGAVASTFLLGGVGQIGPVSHGLQRDRRGIFAGIKDRRLTLGAEFAQRVEGVESGANTVASPRTVRMRTSALTDGFVVVRPFEVADTKERSRLSLVVRFDSFKLDNAAPASATNAATRFIVVGAVWDVTQRASFSLDYQDLKPQAGSTVVPQKIWFMHWIASF